MYVMKNFLLFIVFIITFTECKQVRKNDDDKEIILINNCFLSMIDTMGYRYHSLRPIVLDSGFIKSDSLTIGVYPKLMSLRKWVSELEIVLDTVQLKQEYLSLLKKSVADSTERSFDVEQITNKGKYVLVSEPNRYAHKVRGRIGNVLFSRVYYAEDIGLGLVVAEIRDNSKNGIVKLFLLRKNKIKWNIINEFILEIW